MEEAEWYFIEQDYLLKLLKEREQKERVQLLVKELTKKIKEKDAEIEKLQLILNLSTTALELAVKKLKELEKAQNG